ncbi:hypothetical protein G9X67_34555 [Rhizobium sp. WYCCWR 11152]|uniref:hypothetical protein n=1 Tax=Rhizobium sp. WYCCWR 11152 TaxID=2692316 RepID=UPI001491D7DA|nr:hypothetical protein [Rhizobium sp. WYCCWR 11152]NNU70379.1 hypothetical protein [Rhizobium sp. WYCCWR 11152]
MAKNSFLDWDVVANNNTDAGGIFIGEGCPPSNINNSEREIMAQLKAGLDGKVVYAAKSGNYTAVLNDNNAVLRFTAAATLSLTAVATLVANWHVIVVADGGDVTVDPNASETIDGATTIIIPNGYSALIISNGSAFFTNKMWSIVQPKATMAFGQCRLSLSGANLLLSRFSGQLLTINGVHYSIPSAGITLAPTALTPSTLYYIYAFMSGATMTLEASATAPAVDATTGISIKTADATRTLVGMARPVTGPAWSDTVKQRFVRSWYNDPGVSLFSNFTANRATTSTSYVELNSEIRSEFLNWSGEVVQANAAGSVISGAANGQNRTSLAFDGTTTEPGGSQATLTNSDTVPFSAQAMKSGLSEGYHYVTLIGLVSSGTGTWISDVDGRRTSISGRVSR